MNLKQKMKNFFTLTRKADGGFTLVELIVVIAILAILGGVAVPAYSGYVKKANMQADITLASDVARALQMHYYADSVNATVDYVLLTNREAKADGFAADAMQAAFGDGWENTCVLKHDGWITADTAKAVVESTYLTKSSADDLLGSVSILTDIVAGAVGDGDVTESLAALGIVGDGFADSLSGYTPGTEEYKNAVGNMLVFHVAEEISKPDFDITTAPYVVLWAYQYAYVYAYSSANDPDAIESLNAELVDASAAGSASAIKELLEDKVFYEAMTPEVEAFIESGTDSIAFEEIMHAVTDLSDNILSAGDVGSSSMWTTDGVKNTVNEYFDAIEAISNLDSGEAGIIVMVDQTGGVAYNPDIF